MEKIEKGDIYIPINISAEAISFLLKNASVFFAKKILLIKKISILFIYIIYKKLNQ